jgi:hypothetical protein
MSIAYYAQAITRLLAKLGQAHFYLFSDRPDQSEALLRPLIQGQPCTVVRHNALSGSAEADFWLMRQCQHFIIGNSTFAWWAAWLGEHRNEGAQVFAPARNVDPENNVTAWGFPGLLPGRVLPRARRLRSRLPRRVRGLQSPSKGFVFRMCAQACMDVSRVCRAVRGES